MLPFSNYLEAEDGLSGKDCEVKREKDEEK